MELSQPMPGSSDVYFATRYSQSFFTQFTTCLWKQHLSYWRNPSYNAVRFFFTMMIALLFGTMFWGLGGKMEQAKDLFNVVGSMYAAVLFLGVMNSTSVQPLVAMERTVFYREKAAGMYSAFPYALGQVIIELPYALVQAIIYGFIVYAMMGFDWVAAKFLWYIFVMYVTLLYFTFYGMMAVGFDTKLSHRLDCLLGGLYLLEPLLRFHHAPTEYQSGGDGTPGYVPSLGHCMDWSRHSSAMTRG
ncbi:hypothetical protein ACP70R_002445 [Stipagrostis hirtigluma subsp. patula]